MQYSGKKAILLLCISALHVHCRTMLKTQNMNETDSLLSLKAYEESECSCGSGGACSYVRGVRTCSCKEGFVLNGQTCKVVGCKDDSDCGEREKCTEEGEKGEKKTCKCADGLGGIGCEKMDWCEDFDKLGKCKDTNGICQYDENQKSVVCTCDTLKKWNYYEKICKDTCYNDYDCADNEKCVETYGWKSCQCADGLSGDDCSRIAWCEGDGKFKNCKDGNGTCEYIKDKRAVDCTCDTGKKLHPTENRCRETCQEDSECQNGGKCEGKDGEDKFCSCKSGLIGDRCQTVFDCTSGKYKGCDASGGTCKYDGSKAVCECSGKKKLHDKENICKTCDCGLGGICKFDTFGEKVCTCFSGNSPYKGKCYTCDCGAYGMCILDTGIKRCICDKNYAEKDGKCMFCSCGENSKSCRYDVLGEKECNCSYGYAQKNGYCEECNCGPYGSCNFEFDRKRCICKSFAVEKDGLCVVMTTEEDSTVTRTTSLPSTTRYCNCGEYSKSCHYDWTGYKICDCLPGYVENYGSCEECNCGPYGSCSFENGRKRCHCREFAIEMNGVCVDKGTSPEVTTDSTTTYIISSTTVKVCSCGENSKSCRYDVFGRKECNCSSGYSQKNGYCEECNCGPYGSCSFKYDRKRCNCKSFAVEKNGVCVVMESTTLEDSTIIRTTSLPSTTQYCNCGEFSKSCRYDWTGYKICDCFPGYVENYGSCEECNCGPYGSCSFENGQKKCHCRSSAIEMNGVCVEKGTSTEGTTDSVTTYTTGSTTVKDCDCGRFGRCTFENGQKKCICDPLTSERNGKCVECDCGKNTKSCHFDQDGDRVCNCYSGYSLVLGICEKCNCGVNARSCVFRYSGFKVCNCDFGYAETNGYCTAICNEDKCINGKCEIVENSFKCRCDAGFTGHRCEERIQTKPNKQDVWMVLGVSGIFALILLLSCMFCVLTRILNKMSKK